MSLWRTPFHANHVAAGARMIDFGGWDMPIQYTGIIDEHLAVRKGVGLFDVSHMGEVRVTGPGAEDALNHLLSNDVSKVAPGASQYSAILNDAGGIVDDVFVYRLGEADFLVCVNASNRDKDFAWLVAHNPAPDTVSIVDEGAVWAQVALQGRHGVGVVAELTAVDVAGMERGAIQSGAFAGVDDCWIARTGYTGEDGFEIFLPADSVGDAWDRILAAGAPHDLALVGLGARDTLRLEAGMPLYGRELDCEHNPIEAGLAFGVSFEEEKGDWIGRAALEHVRDNPTRRLVGIQTSGKRAPRQGYALLRDNQRVGVVTSGAISPTVEANIGMAYLDLGHDRAGTTVELDIRGRRQECTVCELPFYSRARK